MSDHQNQNPLGAQGASATDSRTGVNESARIAQFRDDMDRMKLKGASAGSERWMLAVGALLGVVGLALGVLGAVNTVNAGDSPTDQRAFIASGSLLGIVLVIAGAALFVRFSLGRFLRYWLIRLVYEGRADTDRIVDAIERASGLESTVPGAGGATVAGAATQQPPASTQQPPAASQQPPPAATQQPPPVPPQR